MTITVAATASGSINNGGNVTATFSTDGVAGNVVYVGIQHRGVISVSTAGYGTAISTRAFGNSQTLSVFRKVLTATESSVSVTGSGDTASVTSVAVFVLAGVDPSTPEDGITPTTVNTASGQPNPNTITTRTRNAKVLVFAASESTNISATNAVIPTGYTSKTFAGNATAETVAGSIVGCIKTDAISGATPATVEDPDAFTSYSTGASACCTIVLRDLASDLYWVGGTAAWSTTNVNSWANVSGGSGSAVGFIPGAGTNVYFDSASDAGSPFTVTMNASAASGNLTISGLDQVMTLAGTTGLSVFGNLSVPPTNLTITYTGILTFAATSGTKTITTNGQNLNFPITFNGIGGTWQLQDALSVGIATSRAVTLTNGTFDLNEYTLTIYGSFNSTNTNTRVVDFGTTGKIVLTQAGSTLVTVWNTQTGTNLTVLGSRLVEIVGAGTLSRATSASSTDTEPTTFNFSILTTAGTVTFFGRYNNLTYNCTNTTVSGSPSLFGNLTMVTTVTSSSGTTTMIGSNGTITSNGNIIPFSITIDTVGGTTTLNDALTLDITTAANGALTLANGTLNLNNFTATLNRFSSTNTNTRSIAFGTSGKILVSGINDLTNSAIYMDTMGGFSFSGTSNIEANITTAAVTQRIRMGFTSGATESNVMNFTLTGTTGTQQLLGSIKDLTLNTDAIFTTNTGAFCYGNLNHVKVSLTASTGGLTFKSTSGTKTITSNGQILLYPITFDGVGGTWQLQDDLSVGNAASITVTLTNGTLDVADKILTIFGIFSSANANTRTITGTTGWIALSLNTATTILDTSTITNLSATNALFKITGGGATTKTINTGTLSEANAYSVSVEHTAGTVNFTASNTVKNLTINSSATFGNPAITIYGNFTTTAVAYSASNNVITFAGTGTQIITTNGITVDRALTFNSTGTFRLGSAMTMGNRNLTFTQGTLDLNSYNLTVGSTGTFVVNGSTAKVLAQGTGNLILPGANNMNGAGGSNLTSTGTGKISMTSASAKTFTGGTNSYNIISQDGAGALDILGGSTFKSIRNTVQPVTITFEPGTTTTFTDGFELAGTVGNLVTLTSSDAATQYTLSKASGSVTVSYITISYTVATGGSSWIACTDQGAVDGGNNSGWSFTSCASTGNMLLLFL